MSKKSFILFKDSLSILNEMSNEQAGILFKAISDFQNGNESDLDFGMKMAFAPFRNQFIRDDEKYMEFAETQRLKGLKSAEARANRSQPESTKSTDGSIGQPESTKSTYKVNDSVNVNDSDNDLEDKSSIQISSLTQMPSSEKEKRKVAPKEKEPSDDGKRFTDWVIQKIHPVPVKTETIPKIAPMYDKFIRAGYKKEDIKSAVEFATSDIFWREQFLSPMKLDKVNKDKEKFIDIFIAKSKLQYSTKPQPKLDNSSIAHLKTYT
jgi:hypothetical protein